MPDLAAIFRTREMPASLQTRADGSLALSFSTESEIEIWPGEFERLSHAPGACDLSRMQASGMLLFNHNRNAPLARIGSIGIDSDKTGRCVIPKEMRSQSDAASQVWRDIDAGVLQNTSVGYRVLAYTQEKREDGTILYTATKWQPSEVSIVTVPADLSTGVNRADNNQNNTDNMHINRYQRRFLEPDTGLNPPIPSPAPTPVNPAPAPANPAPAPVAPAASVGEEGQRALGVQSERQRVNAITSLCREFNASGELYTRAINEGMNVEQLRGELLRERNASPGIRQPSSGIGLNRQEIQQFSFARLVRSQMEPHDTRLREAAAFEYEACRAAGDSRHGGFSIPGEVLLYGFTGQRADVMSVGDLAPANGVGTATGGALVATTLLAGSFIDALRNKCIAMQICSSMTGLQGEFDIPKQDGIAAAAWIGENDDAPETDINFHTIRMSPKTVAAYAAITRKMLMQPALSVEALIRADIVLAVAQAIDTAFFYGTGNNNQPLGVLKVNGINAAEFAGLWPTYNELVGMESQIAAENADAASMKYIAHTGFRGYAKTALKFPMVSEGGQLKQVASGGTIWEPGNTVNGYGAEITNQIALGDILFGNWADAIVGFWGGLDMMVDPYSLSKKGAVQVTAFQDTDVVIRRTESFCYGKKVVAEG